VVLDSESASWSELLACIGPYALGCRTRSALYSTVSHVCPRKSRGASSAECRLTRLRDAEVGSSNLPHPTRTEVVSALTESLPTSHQGERSFARAT
jgi:hypothetical protein